MKLNKLAQVMLVSCLAMTLGACSANKHRSGDSAMDEGGMGAQASGYGQSGAYGDQGGSDSRSAKNTFYFDYDRSDIRSEDRPAILASADKLVAHPNAHITLEGNTDPRGSREYNVALGERRGNAVLEVMKTRGVNPSQVRVVSYGAERLAVPGHTEQDYQLDRRVVLVNKG
jgi:peptidoglycan-associated lipoprotein